jgi:hypothetical protein
VTSLAYYFVTDIERDGSYPARNSMLSFASVVLREDDEICGEFEAQIAPPRNYPQTHRADDERGYASLLAKLFTLARQSLDRPEEFLRGRNERYA